MKNLRAILLLSSMAWLSACQQMPAKAPAPGGAAAPGAPAETVPSAVAPAPQVPAAPSGPVTAASQQQAQRTAMAAMSMLEAGHEEEAKAELQRALAADPNNKLATNLLRQIGTDPVSALGRESFSYTVRPNETLSMIAGRFLGDIYSFYILARYNNIAVPRLVAGGQTLRIPGKGPPPPTAVREPPRAEPVPLPPTPTVAVPAAPAPPPEPSVAERAMRAGEAAERRGELDAALDQYQKAASLNESGANAKADQVRRQLVQRHSLSARTAFAKQDLDGAIRAWDRVLRVDPANDNAKFERQRAMTLKEKAGKL
jgi:tetratricopeptide (TPR) repeat protein